MLLADGPALVRGGRRSVRAADAGARERETGAAHGRSRSRKASRTAAASRSRCFATSCTISKGGNAVERSMTNQASIFTANARPMRLSVYHHATMLLRSSTHSNSRSWTSPITQVTVAEASGTPTEDDETDRRHCACAERTGSSRDQSLIPGRCFAGLPRGHCFRPERTPRR